MCFCTCAFSGERERAAPQPISLLISYSILNKNSEKGGRSYLDHFRVYMCFFTCALSGEREGAAPQTISSLISYSILNKNREKGERRPRPFWLKVASPTADGTAMGRGPCAFIAGSSEEKRLVQSLGTLEEQGVAGRDRGQPELLPTARGSPLFSV